jgi:hypothetical protein
MVGIQVLLLPSSPSPRNGNGEVFHLSFLNSPKQVLITFNATEITKSAERAVSVCCSSIHVLCCSPSLAGTARRFPAWMMASMNYRDFYHMKPPFSLVLLEKHPIGFPVDEPEFSVQGFVKQAVSHREKRSDSDRDLTCFPGKKNLTRQALGGCHD